MLSFWAACPPALAAGTEDDSVGQYYVVKVWAAEDGFAEGSVTDVAQTSEGYLWIGTLFGSVLRFDGTRFVSYNSANTPEFSLKWGGSRLMTDREGQLWVSMYEGGLITWNQGGFRTTLTSTNHPERLLWSAPGRVVFIDSARTLLSGQLRGEQWDWQIGTLPGALPQGQPFADVDG